MCPQTLSFRGIVQQLVGLKPFEFLSGRTLKAPIENEEFLHPRIVSLSNHSQPLQDLQNNARVHILTCSREH
jgi:hypothetical protein